MQRARAQQAVGLVHERTYVRSRNGSPDRRHSPQPTPASYPEEPVDDCPTMILVSSSTSWWIRLAASSTSYSVNPRRR